MEVFKKNICQNLDIGVRSLDLQDAVEGGFASRLNAELSTCNRSPKK
jgi:hypothetical protein